MSATREDDNINDLNVDNLEDIVTEEKENNQQTGLPVLLHLSLFMYHKSISLRRSYT